VQVREGVQVRGGRGRDMEYGEGGVQVRGGRVRGGVWSMGKGGGR